MHDIKKDCCVEDLSLFVQRLVRIFQMFERDQVKPYGFTISQSYTMIELLKNNELTMNELSDKMNLSKSTMTRIVDKLVRDGFIVRTKGEEDRRIVIIKLTDAGLKVVKEVNQSITEYYKKIIDNLPTGDVEDVLDSVSHLLNAFEKANPNCC